MNVLNRKISFSTTEDTKGLIPFTVSTWIWTPIANFVSRADNLYVTYAVIYSHPQILLNLFEFYI